MPIVVWMRQAASRVIPTRSCTPPLKKDHLRQVPTLQCSEIILPAVGKVQSQVGGSSLSGKTTQTSSTAATEPHDREHGGNARSDASRPHGLCTEKLEAMGRTNILLIVSAVVMRWGFTCQKVVCPS